MEQNLLEKLQNIKKKILENKKISLFIVIQKEDSNLWDLVMAGDGLDNQENLAEITGIINKELDKNEVINFSRLVLIDSKNTFAKNINQAFKVDEGAIQIKNSKFNETFIKEAYLLYSHLE